MQRISVGDYSPIHLKDPVRRHRVCEAGIVRPVQRRENDLNAAMTPFAGDGQQYLVGRVVIDFA
jgi:hypothetical protein